MSLIQVPVPCLSPFLCLYATLLALMGLDHENLTYRYGGRDFRLADVAGRAATAIFA
jgi:hypothetical protein